MADREPIGGSGRRTGEMIDPRPAQGATHASHDLFVIAAAADREADAKARAAADEQMRECAECSALFADLRAISAGLASMPREVPVTRDFRLTPERAASLRRRGLRPFLGGFRLGPSLRPVGTALATLGFAGLLLTVGLPALMSGGVSTILSTVGSSVGPEFGAGAAPAASQAGTGGKTGSVSPGDQSGAAAGPPSERPAAAASAMPAASGYDVALNGQASTSTDSAGGEPRAAARGPVELLQSLTENPPNLLTIAAWLSLGAVVVGLGLLLAAGFRGRARSG